MSATTFLLFSAVGLLGVLVTIVYCACVAAKPLPHEVSQPEDWLGIATMEEEELYLPSLPYPYLDQMHLDALPFIVERRVLVS